MRKTNRKDSGGIRRADVFLIAFFLLLTFVCLIGFAPGQKEGRTLRISCDGQILAEVPLAQAAFRETAGADTEAVRRCLLLFSEEGVTCEWYDSAPDLASDIPEGVSYNLLAVSGERVWMEAADCRDQICVQHIPIAGGGESIICLPHKLVAEIVGKTDVETVDGITGTGLSARQRKGLLTGG